MLNFTASSDPVFEQSLQVVLGAVPAAELAWVSSYEHLEADDLSLISQDGLTTNTTPVTVVSVPPPDSDAYQLKSFYTKNQNAAPVTFIVQFNDTGTLREILRVTLSQHDSLIYEQSNGWRVLDSSGRVKIAFAISSSTGLVILVQADPLAATLTDTYTVPAGKRFSGHINVTNRSATPSSIRISLAPNGAVDALTQYLVYDIPFSGNNVYDSVDFSLDELDVIRVYATDATFTFTIIGEETLV